MTAIGRRIIVLVAAAAAAVTVALVIMLVATANRGGQVLSPEDVARQLDDGASPSAGATPDDSPTADPTAGPSDVAASGPANRSVLRATGITLVADCTGNQVSLITWTPKAGYRVDDVVRGPAAQATVKVESDQFNDVDVVVQCVDGRATVRETVEFDDHGRGGGGSDDRSGRR